MGEDAGAEHVFTSVVVSAIARPKILLDMTLAGSKLTAIPALRDRWRRTRAVCTL